MTSASAAETLIATYTADGLQLDGLLLQPEATMGDLAIIWIQGFGANFYFPPYLRLARALAALGYPCMLVNTRGHDVGTMLFPHGGAPYLGGAAWEQIDESPHDIAAWVAWADTRGFAGTVLVGHSLGAVKVLYYQAQRQDHRVRGVGLASPPLRPTWNTRAHPTALAHAQQLVASGQPEQLFAGPWGTVSAQTYLGFDRVSFDQFGRDSPTPNLLRVRCPVLALAGADEDWVCQPEDLAIIQRAATPTRSIVTQIVAGADHLYTGREQEVATLIAEWMTTLPSTPVTALQG